LNDDHDRTGRSTSSSGRNGGGRRNQEITLHRLRIFWAVAHSETLTKASKQLGLTQPSLSQQIASLEAGVGTALFERRSNQMILTEAGDYLLRKAEVVLRDMQELEDGLSEFNQGLRVTIRLAGLTSVLRVLLPAALRQMRDLAPHVDYDIQESAPADVLELLYGRRIHIGLIASNSISQASAGFLRLPLMADPYVLAVPESLNLDGITDPARQLGTAERAILRASIHFAFGTQHTKRVQEWYDQVLPGHVQVAQARSFDVAIGMVRAGLGVCFAPVLSAVVDDGVASGVRLYEVQVPRRQIVALVPSQYRYLKPYSMLLDALAREGAAFAMPAMLPTPPFLDRADVAETFAL
jgi:DNA-binding transcriptional LysR family regulator